MRGSADLSEWSISRIQNSHSTPEKNNNINNENNNYREECSCVEKLIIPVSNQSEYDEAVDTEGDEGEEHLEHVRGSDEGEEDHDGESTSVGVILTKTVSQSDNTQERERECGPNLPEGSPASRG